MDGAAEGEAGAVVVAAGLLEVAGAVVVEGVAAGVQLARRKTRAKRATNGINHFFMFYSLPNTLPIKSGNPDNESLVFCEYVVLLSQKPLKWRL